MTPRILFVDDEPNVLAAVQRGLRSRYQVETALSGDDGLRRIENQGPFAVVVADMHMPGMNGLEFLRRASSLAPDTVRVMLTGDGDQQTAIEAVNQGQVFRFLTKPCGPGVLEHSLTNAVHQHRLIRAEREVLECTLNGSIEILTEILSLMDPGAFGRCQTTRDYARHVGRALRLESLWELELAAMLCRVGLVSVPPAVVEKMRKGISLTGVEKDILARVPQVGSGLLAKIPRLQRVAQIVLYQDKHFDGSGFPHDRTRGTDIPVESRILRVLLDLTAAEESGVAPHKALARMREHPECYDPEILSTITRCLGIEPATPSPATAAETRRLSLGDLRPGDVLGSDVKTRQGLMIIARDTRLTPLLLERLRSFAELNGVEEPILVKASPAPEAPDAQAPAHEAGTPTPDHFATAA